MSEWQKIETAPKDGTVIDGCNRFGDRTTDVRWHKDQWCTWGLDIFDTMGLVTVDIPLTHWMPIPTPPSKDD